MTKDISTLLQLEDFAKDLSSRLQPGDVVFLKGDLGAGKTTFTQFLIKSLGYDQRVKSPTYAIYETYNLDKATVYHIDLYRIGNQEEIYYLGIDDIFNGENIVIIEWPERGNSVLPEPSMIITFELLKNKKRIVNLHIT